MSRLRARGGIEALIVAVTLLGGLGGCVRYYWSKPSATPEDFNRDSTQWPTLKTGVFVEQMYRSCLSAKGWVRDKQYDPPPPGWYRGVE